MYDSIWQYVTFSSCKVIWKLIFETNKAGMFAIEKLRKTLLEILDLE